MGFGKQGNFVQNTLASAVRNTPTFLTKMVGLEHLFKVRDFYPRILPVEYLTICRLQRKGSVLSSNVQDIRSVIECTFIKVNFQHEFL